jgi:hypothetical protein
MFFFERKKNLVPIIEIDLRRNENIFDGKLFFFWILDGTMVDKSATRS